MDQGRGLLPSSNLSKEGRNEERKERKVKEQLKLKHRETDPPLCRGPFRPLLRSSSFSEALPPLRRPAGPVQTPAQARRFIPVYYRIQGCTFVFSWIPLATGNGFTQFRRGTKLTRITPYTDRQKAGTRILRCSAAAESSHPFVLLQATQRSEKNQNVSSQFMSHEYIPLLIILKHELRHGWKDGGEGRALFTFLPDDALNGVSGDGAGHRDRPAFHRLYRRDGADARRTCEEEKENEMEIIARSGLLRERKGRRGVWSLRRL